MNKILVLALTLISSFSYASSYFSHETCRLAIDHKELKALESSLGVLESKGYIIEDEISWKIPMHRTKDILTLDTEFLITGDDSKRRIKTKYNLKLRDRRSSELILRRGVKCKIDSTLNSRGNHDYDMSECMTKTEKLMIEMPTCNKRSNGFTYYGR